MICDSIAWLNSSATDTVISKPVAPNAPAKPGLIKLKIIAGIRATSARYIAPKSVILLEIFLRCSAVGLPGLIPGIKPPLP